MNNRFKQIRITEGLNQTEFGELLGLTKSGVSDIESGRRNVTEQHIIMLNNCKKFKHGNLNVDWLRTGEGEMFLAMDRQSEIAKLTVDLLTEESDSFKSRLISALARLTEDQWELLAQIAENITKKE